MCFLVVLLLSAAPILQGTVRMGTLVDGQTATRRPLPAYPAASVTAGTSGVAVAEFRTDTAGKVVWADVLEAPDSAVAGAVREAVMQWTFEPVTILGRENEPRARAGKLIFYFVVENGRGVVRSPEEMPGGPKPRPRPSGRAPGPPPPGPPPGPPAALPAGAAGHGEQIPEIREAELAARAANERLAVVDTRVRDAFRRGHREGAVNIPRDELQIRGGIELRGHRVVVVDCTNDDMRWCRISGEMLARAGLPEVLLLVK